MSRQKREAVASELAKRKQSLVQRRSKIKNDQAFVSARNQLQTDYGVDIVGEMLAGVDDSVALVEWIENYLNLDIGSNKPQ